ncbi:MAG: S8 family peptidase [Candidatus Poseidoniaceae archaeon]
MEPPTGIPPAPVMPEDTKPAGTELTAAFVALAVLAAGVFAVVLLLPEENLLIQPSRLALDAEEQAANLVEAEKGYTGLGVEVCIVDSGIDLQHRDMDHLTLSGWNDVVGNGTSPYDDHGHGTSMAGILVADGGLTGLAPDVNLHVVKALSSSGEGDDQDLADAVDWCIDQGAHIISLSLGGAPGALSFLPGGGRASEAAVERALAQGIFVVAAAGNDGGSGDDGDVASPGSVDLAISVGGVHLDGAHWSGSSIGDNDGRLLPLPILFPRQDPDKKPELMAPGAGVAVVNAESNSWSLVNGTSASTVFVTAALAHLLEARPDLRSGDVNNSAEQTIEDVKTKLMETARPLPGQDGHDDAYGYGIVQINRLLDAYR